MAHDQITKTTMDTSSEYSKYPVYQDRILFFPPNISEINGAIYFDQKGLTLLTYMALYE